MEDISHHGTIILYDFKVSFLRKKSAKDDSFKFFEFIPPPISTWVQHVLQGMPKTIHSYFGRSSWKRIIELWEHGVYGWMMEEHQPIGIDYQPIRDDNYIENLMVQHYMEFNEDR